MLWSCRKSPVGNIVECVGIIDNDIYNFRFYGNAYFLRRKNSEVMYERIHHIVVRSAYAHGQTSACA